MADEQDATLVSLVQEVTYGAACEVCGSLGTRMTERDATIVARSHRCGDWGRLIGRRVEVVDVKKQPAMTCIGRTGVINRDPDFGHTYLAFDDGGSAGPDDVIIEPIP